MFSKMPPPKSAIHAVYCYKRILTRSPEPELRVGEENRQLSTIIGSQSIIDKDQAIEEASLLPPPDSIPQGQTPIFPSCDEQGRPHIDLSVLPVSLAHQMLSWGSEVQDFQAYIPLSLPASLAFTPQLNTTSEAAQPSMNGDSELL